MGVLESGIRTELPVRGYWRITIRILLSGRGLLNVNCGHLLFHELCWTAFRVWCHPSECAICLRPSYSGSRAVRPVLTRDGG
jgi:hypothetical protein